MRLRPTLILSLLIAPLAAQTFISMQKAEAKAPANLQEWTAQVRELGWGGETRWALVRRCGDELMAIQWSRLPVPKPSS